MAAQEEKSPPFPRRPTPWRSPCMRWAIRPLVWPMNTSITSCAHDHGHDNHSGSEPSQPNITTNKNPATTKWRNLIRAGTTVPTTQNANCAGCDPQPSPVPAGTVGLFEGADYYHCRVYRPEFNSRMRNLNQPFCGVCQQVITKKLTPFLPPS